MTWKPRTETDGGWWAKLSWSWGKFCDPEMVEGVICNRYPTGMRRAIDQVMEMAEQFGVATPPNVPMALYVDGDGEDDVLPAGWMNKVRREAARRDWDSYPAEPVEEATNNE
jgi:hypothetical protein